MSDFAEGKFVWIVYEDNHGAVSYWDTAQGADDEVNRIIEDIYEGDFSVKDECVCCEARLLNEPW